MGIRYQEARGRNGWYYVGIGLAMDEGLLSGNSEAAASSSKTLAPSVSSAVHEPTPEAAKQYAEQHAPPSVKRWCPPWRRRCGFGLATERKESPMSGKSSKAMRDQRVNEVLQLELAGMSRQQIIQYATVSWGVSIRTTDKYLAAARAVLKEELVELRRIALAEHLAARRALRFVAHEQKDWRLVLDCLRDEAKLWGLYETDVVSRLEAIEDAIQRYGLSTARRAEEAR